MILPDNGKVVVIDDKPDEVKALISALSKEKVPFVYYSKEDGSDLPEQPINNVRLIFLDLLLVVDSENLSPQTVIGIIASRLRSILSRENGPYVLIYWSTQEDRFKKPLENAFKTILADFAPFISFSMPKTDNLETIKSELHLKFKNFKSLNAFLLFESIVNKSGGEIYNDYTSIYERDSNWNRNLKGVIYSLSQSLVGKKNTIAATNKEKMKYAFSTIANTLIENIERNLENFSNLDIRKIENINHSEGKLLKINSKLHLLYSLNGFRHFQSGNLYLINNDSHDINRLIIDNTESNSKANEVISSNPKMVELDVTPSCDYAQNKFYYVRLLPGILTSIVFSRKYFKNTEYNYNLCPPMKIENHNHYLLFDYRFLRTLKMEELKSNYNRPKYRLRTELLVDIQTGLAKHMNRPGIISVS
jgi:hypothetical protein